MSKVTVVGAGNVGATCANVLLFNEVADQVVMLDVKEGIAEGHATGLAEGIAKGHATGLAEGISKGHATGLAEGKLEEKKNLLKNLLKMNMDIETISKATGLTKDELEKLKKEI